MQKHPKYWNKCTKLNNINYKNVEIVKTVENINNRC